MIVANLQVIEDLVDPDHAATGIADKIVVKTRRAFRRSISKARNQVRSIVGQFQIEQVVVNFNPVANKLK